VVTITDEAVLTKVHQNYHLTFLKDVVLPRALDDSSFASLNQIAFLNNVHIMSSLSNDGEYLQVRRIRAQSNEPCHTANGYANRAAIAAETLRPRRAA